MHFNILNKSYGMAVFLGLFIICALPFSPEARTEQAPGTTAFSIFTNTDDLQHPWGMAFLPDSRILVTERPGRLRIISQGKLQDDPVPGLPATDRPAGWTPR